MWNINAPQGRIPCAIFTKFAEFVPHLRMRVKIWLDLLKGLWSYGGFKLRGSGFPQIFGAPSGETMHQTTKRFGGERTCSRSSYHHVKFGGARISPAAGVAKNVEFFLSVCRSVCSSRFRCYAFVVTLAR